MAPPINDDVVDATLVLAPGSISGTTIDATYEAEELAHGFNQPSAWYRVELPPGQNTLVISITGADYAFFLAAWEPLTDPPSGFDDVYDGNFLNQMGGPTNSDKTVTLTSITPGGVVYVYMGDYEFDGTTGSFDAAFTVGPLSPPPAPPPPSPIEVYIDGTDVTGVAIKGSVTRRLNRPAQATVTLPMDAAIGGPGSRLLINIPGVPGTVTFHGFILDCETDTGEDTGYTVYNAADPMELWQWRPVRDSDGDFTNPDIVFDWEEGPQIIYQALLNSENAGAGPPTDAEGPLFLDYGSFSSSGVSLIGAPTDWPMTIMELASLLVSSGELDIVIDCTDPGGGVMGTVYGFDGDYGSDLTGSVSFEYATGALNVRRLRWNEDMTNVCNKLWYFAGPRIGSRSDPSGLQHWCWNITGDDPGLADPPGGDIDYSNPIGDRRLASQAAVGVRMEIQIFDAMGELCLGDAGKYPGGEPGRDLYRRLWQAESWARSVPRELIHITPVRGAEIGTFDIGDIVAVSAGASVRGGFSGAQRVYQYTISWEEDGPLELSELQTSSDVGVGN